MSWSFQRQSDRETCGYYACEWDGEILPNQTTIKDKFSGNDRVFHTKCYVEWMNEVLKNRRKK